MTILAEPVGVASSDNRRKRYGWSVADLTALPEELVGVEVSWELWDGELVALAPPNETHSVIANRIGGELFLQGEKAGLGRATGEVGIVLGGESGETAVGADAAFRTREQVPSPRSPEGYMQTVPAIVVEVRSPSNRVGRVREKVERYLAEGARLVWDVDPERRQVTAHRPNEAPQVFVETDTLTAEGIIPEFSLPLQELFGNLD